LAILVLNVKSGFSIDALWIIFKDLPPLIITIMIFYMLNGFLFHSFDFKKTADKVIKKIRQRYRDKRYGDIFATDTNKSEKENAEECLFSLPNRKNRSYNFG
jgi:hypothetical protein